MAIEVQSGSLHLTVAEQTVATLASYHPRVSVYVVPSGAPAEVGSQWRVYSVANGVRALLAQGKLLQNTRNEMVLGNIEGSGNTIELAVASPFGATAANIQGIIVGFDPSDTIAPKFGFASGAVALSNAEQDVATLNAAYADLTVTINPNADPLALNSIWTVYAVAAGHRTQVFSGRLTDLSSEQFVLIRDLIAGGTSFVLTARGVLASSLVSIDAVIFGTVLSGGGGGGGTIGLTSLNLAVGPQEGGTTVEGFGTGIATGATVSVGGHPATAVMVSADGETVTFVTPPGAPNPVPVDVVVTNPTGEAATLPAAYTYWNPSLSTGALAAWWDASQPATCFQNVGGTVPAVDGGALARINDRRGGANPAIIATQSVGGTVVVNPMTYRVVQAGNPLASIEGSSVPNEAMLMTPAAVTWKAVLMVVRSRQTAFNANPFDTFFAVGTAFPNGNVFYGFGGQTTFQAANGAQTCGLGQFYAEDLWSGTPDPDYGQVGGTDEWHVIATLLPATRADKLIVGGYFDQNQVVNGWIGEVVVLGAGATDADMKTNMQYLAAKWRNAYTSEQVLWDGDSLYAGFGVPSPPLYIPQKTLDDLAHATSHPVAGFHLQNLGVSGQTLAQMLTRQSWSVLAKLGKNLRRLLPTPVLVQEWINAYFGDLQTPEQIIAETETYVANVKAVDSTAPVVVSSPSFTSMETTAQNEADRQTIRDGLIIDSLAGKFALADIGNPLSPLGDGQWGTPANPRFYLDQATHFSPDGTSVASAITGSVLGGLLAGLLSQPAPGPTIQNAIVDPLAGDPAGGYNVKIILPNIPRVTGVLFGATAATNVKWKFPWLVTCTVPAGALSLVAVDVTLQLLGGGTIVLPAAFTYFNPSLLPDLNLWVRGDVGTPASWTDQSGAGNNFLQPVAGLQPAASNINGKPSFFSDGTSVMNAVIASPPVVSAHLYIVAKATVDPPVSSNDGALWYWGSGGNPFTPFANDLLYETALSTVRYDAISKKGIPTNKAFRLEIQGSTVGPTWNMLMNSVPLHSEFANVFSYPANVQIFSNLAAGNWKGDIGEIVSIHERLLSVQEQKLMASYMKSYWGMVY